MDSKNITFVARIIIALLLAIQIWVWLRYAGAFWLSDSLGFIKEMVKSLDPLKVSLYAFLILVMPALVVGLLMHKSMSIGMRIVFYSLLGSLYSTLYLIFMAKLDITFIKMQMWVYITAGGIAGLCYGSILDLKWRIRSSSDDKSDILQQRRNLLGSLGLFAGAAGFLGALAGPYFFWKNRNTYVDINVDRLEDGQMMTVEVANKPVWILRRTPEMISLLEQENQRLLDPLSASSKQPESARNPLRSIRPEYFIAYGICTHLGCSPSYRREGWAGVNPAPQFFCPCHGGVFDLAGRVYKDTPPPENMVIPIHEFVSEGVVRLYFPSLSEEWNA